MRAVNYDSGPRILFVVSDIIIHEDNNVFILQPILPQQLVGMTNVSLKLTKSEKKISYQVINHVIKH